MLWTALQWTKEPIRGCGGEGFDGPLVYQNNSMIYSRLTWRLFCWDGQSHNNFSRSKLHCPQRRLLNHSHLAFTIHLNLMLQIQESHLTQHCDRFSIRKL